MTSSPNRSMEVRASLVRNSVRMSFQRMAPTWLRKCTTPLSQELLVTFSNPSCIPREFLRNCALFQQRPAVYIPQSLLQIMGSHEYGLAAANEIFHPGAQELGSFQVQHGEWLPPQQE